VSLSIFTSERSDSHKVTSWWSGQLFHLSSWTMDTMWQISRDSEQSLVL